MKHTAVFAAFCLLMASCAELQENLPGELGGDNDQKYSVNGNVQKGPFTQGTSISIQPLDDELNPTGKNYQTRTIDDAGTFWLDNEIESRYVEIIASGYYFNENTGKVSSSTLTLRALSDLAEEGQTNVNILTTLEFDRIRTLVKNQNKSIYDARVQAEKELFDLFHIPEELCSTEGFDKMDITRSGESNAILLAISASLQGERSEGELSELISKIGAEISESGKVENKLIIDQIRAGGMTVSEDKVRDNLTARYNALGLSDYTIPAFEDYLDINGNGVIDKLDKWIVLSNKDVQISDEGGNFYVEIRHNVDYDIIIDNCDWINRTSSDTRAYLEKDMISFSVNANDTYDERSAMIIFRDAVSGIEDCVNVYQKQLDAITVTADRFDVGKDGGTVDIEVKANVDYEVDIDPYTAKWITPVPQTKGLSANVLRYNVAPNEESGQRTGTIKFYSGNLTETVKIYQTGEKILLILSDKNPVISDEGGTVCIDIKSNIDYEIVPDEYCNWIKQISKTNKGISIDRIELTVDPNSEYDDRYGRVTVREKGGQLNDVLTVHQTQKDAIIIANESYQFDRLGGILELGVRANVDITVEISEASAGWIKEMPETKGLVDHNVRFLIEENTAYDSREGEIIVRCEAKGITKTIKIIQGQTDAIFISTHEQKMTSAGGKFSVEVSSNLSYDVEISAGWIHPDASAVQTKGLVSGALHFNVDKNTSKDDRTGTVTFINRMYGVKECLTVTQSGKETVIVDRTFFDVGRQGGILPITVMSNVDYEVVIEQGEEWISVAPATKALVETTVNLSIAPNTDLEARAGKVVIRDKVTDANDYFTINQDGNTEKITLHVEKAGTLNELITRENIVKYEQVTVTGNMNQSDADLLAGVGEKYESRKLQILDLSEVTFNANTIGGFNNMPNLVEVHLPPTLRVLYNANGNFNSCPLLSVVDFGENPQLEALKGESWQNSLDGHGVIGSFSNCPSLVRLELPSSVTTIEPGSFKGQSVKELIIPANSRLTILEGKTYRFSTSMGGFAYYETYGVLDGNSSIETMTVPASVKIIDNEAFRNMAGLKHLEIPETVTMINTDGLFAGCSSLETVFLPGCAKNIGASMFEGCTNLESFDFAGGYTAIGDNAFVDCENLKTVDLEGVKEFGKKIFKGAGIEHIRIPDTMIEIPESMFAESKLKSVDLNKTEIIGKFAFSKCMELASVVWSSSLKRIELHAFEGSYSSSYDGPVIEGGSSYDEVLDESKWPVGTLTLPSSVEYVGDMAFHARKYLTELKITSERIVLGDNICNMVPLEVFTIGKDVKSIICDHNSPLAGTGRINFDAPETFENIVFEPGSQCEEFGICGALPIYDFELPASVRKLSARAFKACGNISDASLLNILKNIEEIGEEAFGTCDNLKFITIPENVKFIGPDAFAGNSYFGSSTYNDYIRGINILGDVVLAPHAFRNLSKLVSLETPNVTTVGNAAFSECKNLLSVSMPKVETVGSYAFRDCENLLSVSMPKVETIKFCTFVGCSSLSSVEMPQVRTIADVDVNNRSSAFSGCTSLTSVLMPSVETIGESAFSGCTGLAEIDIPNIVYLGYKAFEGCVGLKTFDMPASLQTCSGCFNNLEMDRITLRTCDNKQVISFGCKSLGELFLDCELPDGFRAPTVPESTKITFKEGITRIGNGVFKGYKCALDIPSSVTEIGNSTFSGCTWITSIDLSNVVSVGGYAFSNCTNLSSVNLPSLASAGEYAFYGTSLTSVDLPDLTTVGGYAFSNCTNLSSVNLPSLASAGEYAFYGTSLTSVDLPDLTTVGGCAFSNCTNLSSVNLPSAVSVGYESFKGCTNLTSMSMPSVETISGGAFDGCTGLKTFVVPETLKSMGNKCFDGLEMDKIVWKAILASSQVNLGLVSLGELFLDCDLPDDFYAPTVPESAKITFKKGITRIGNDVFNGYKCVLDIPSSVTEIGNRTFYNCIGLTSIDLPNVVSVGDYAFYNCTNLTSVSMPSVETIGGGAFDGCTGLKTFVVPETLKSMGNKCFDGLEMDKIVWKAILASSQVNLGLVSLGELFLDCDLPDGFCAPTVPESTKITLKEGLTRIGNYALANCKGLTDTDIPSSVTEIGNGALKECTGLVSIDLPNVVSVGDEAFYWCSNLSSVNLPSAVSVGKYSFRGCTALTSLSSDNFASLATIGDYAFRGCSNILSVSLSATMESVGSSAFYDCKNLTEIYCASPVPPALRSSSFPDTVYGVPVYVPTGSIEAYKAADYWKSFTNFIEKDF